MKLSIYKSAHTYNRGIDGMRNELSAWFVAAGILLQEISAKAGNVPFGGLENKTGYEENKKLPEIEILDLCSGPGNFVNHLSFAYPNINAICVDSNSEFVAYGSERFPRWRFIVGDAVKIHLDRTFDFVTMSSGYHHIPDDQKLALMKNIAAHLREKGKVVVCENILPSYKNDTERPAAVNLFYDEFQKCRAKGELTESSALLLEEVRQSDLRQDDERKVSYEIFREHVESAGLAIEKDIAVWQPQVFKESNAGTHVFVLRKGS